MSKTKMNWYSGEFKAKMAQEALKEGTTIAARFSVHPNQASEWKKQAIEGLAAVFARKTDRDNGKHEAEVKELHAKIGQLIVERDLLAKASGL